MLSEEKFDLRSGVHLNSLTAEKKIGSSRKI